MKLGNQTCQFLAGLPAARLGGAPGGQQDDGSLAQRSL